jgi:threonine dehydratase
MTENGLPSFDDIKAARERIRAYVQPTPVTSDGDLLYKLDFLQPTGSFKVRGAFNAALQLEPGARARGVVAVSGGNHGLAVAYAGQTLGIPATIFMPQTTPAFVIDAARRFGAQIRLTATIAESMERARELASDGKGTLLHPFDDAEVIAGQGTIGLEVLEQAPSAGRVIVSIGGGGLIAGIAAAMKHARPGVRIAGVETHGADAMRQALDARRVVELPGITSIARTLGAPSVSERTLRAAQDLVDDVVVVDDRDAVAAMAELQERLGVLVEPAAACTLAALRTGALPAEPGTLLVLCGRNVRLTEVQAWQKQFGLAGA